METKSILLSGFLVINSFLLASQFQQRSETLTPETWTLPRYPKAGWYLGLIGDLYVHITVKDGRVSEVVETKAKFVYERHWGAYEGSEHFLSVVKEAVSQWAFAGPDGGFNLKLRFRLLESDPLATDHIVEERYSVRVSEQFPYYPEEILVEIEKREPNATRY